MAWRCGGTGYHALAQRSGTALGWTHGAGTALMICELRRCNCSSEHCSSEHLFSSAESRGTDLIGRGEGGVELAALLGIASFRLTQERKTNGACNVVWLGYVW